MNNENNQRNYWISAIAVVLIIIVGVAIWRANSTPTSLTATSTPVGSTMVLPYGTVTLGLGQEGVFPGITITPISVSQDNRCAASVQCVTAGTVKILVKADLDTGATLQSTVMLGSTTPIDAFNVTLVTVTPGQTAGQSINPSDYRFTFDVHQSANGAGLQGKG